MNLRDKPSFGPTTVNGALTVTGKVSAAVPVQLPIYTVATLPAGTAGQLAFCSNGAQGSPSLVWHDGTNWIEEDGTAAAAS
jgi:hypothetical protein